MFGSEEKLDNEQLRKNLEEEKKSLLEVTHRIFWNSLFMEAYKTIGLGHRNSSGKNYSYYLVRDHIDRFLVDLCKEYDLETTMQNKPTCSEYKLKISRLNEDYFSDSVMIFIGVAGIELRMLSGLFLETFSLEEYGNLEKLLSEVCDLLYERGKLSELLYKHLQIEQSDSDLTVKTVEIAQNSIRAIYNARKERIKDLDQKYLYSVLNLQGKRLRVMHKDFLEAPEDLMKELGKI